jgi:RNA polymerase nonessential primary-like sigma factor
VGAARAEHANRARHFGLEVEELVQEGLGAVHLQLRRFRPGRAGEGRTLFPAWALRVARQAMGRLVQERRAPVPLTSWGQKLRRKALRRVRAAGIGLREALEAEGASPASVAALERGAVETVSLVAVAGSSLAGADNPGSDAYRESNLMLQISEEAHAEAEAHHAQLQLGEDAMAALAHLPERQRMAVAGTLGLEGPATPARVLARRMGCTPSEVEALCAAGLATLRGTLEAE